MTKKSSTSEEVVMRRESEEMKFRGVRKRKWGKWVSEIRLPNSRERIWLGSFDTPEKAARAFDAAQFCLRGRAGNFNFPENPPDIPGGRAMTPAEIQDAAARFAHAHSERVPTTTCQRSTTTTSTTTTEETEVAYSPSISEGSTAQMERESEVTGVQESFYEQLRLAEVSIGSGNYAEEFGLLPGFDDLNCGNFYSPYSQLVNFDYGNMNISGGDDFYDASIYQDSSLWSF